MEESNRQVLDITFRQNWRIFELARTKDQAIDTRFQRTKIPFHFLTHLISQQFFSYGSRRTNLLWFMEILRNVRIVQGNESRCRQKRKQLEVGAASRIRHCCIARAHSRTFIAAAAGIQRIHNTSPSGSKICQTYLILTNEMIPALKIMAPVTQIIHAEELLCPFEV